MISCKNCGSPQWLHIVESKILFIDGRELTELDEHYECTMCKGKGRYKENTESWRVSGDVEIIDNEVPV